MSKRIAAATSLVVFAVCLLIGGLQTGNAFSTSVWRALVAMVVTLVVGLIVGAMAQRMLDENLAAHEKKLRQTQADDR